MITSYDSKIYNDDQPYIDYVVKDILSSDIYSILIDEDSEIYAEITTDQLHTFDIIDGLSGASYGLFVYDGQVFSAPIKNSEGDLIYGNDCFISAGATIKLKIKRNSDVDTDVSDIDIKIFSQETEQFLSTEISLFEMETNYFVASFVIPIQGDFLALVHLESSLFLTKGFTVQNYSYSEIESELKKVSQELNNINNDEAYI